MVEHWEINEGHVLPTCRGAEGGTRWGSPGGAAAEPLCNESPAKIGPGGRMRLAELLEMCRREMAAAGIDAGPEAEILVSSAARIPRSRLFPEKDREVGDLTGTLRAWIGRRAAGEPVQYILGAW